MVRHLKHIATVFLLFAVITILCACKAEKSDTIDSWHLDSMNVSQLWEYSKGASQTIAFIDTGISDTLAEELFERIVFQYNVLDNNKDVTDVHGHGTELVSVACGNGFYDVWGIAPEANIIIIKAVSDEGKTSNAYLLEGLKVAEEHGATIVNISLGGFKGDEGVTEQINSMVAEGITIVAAAGDYRNKDLLFPANQKNVISVEAMNEDATMWEDSNHSEDSSVRMPGSNISALTVQADGDIIQAFVSGTSQAAAIASGYVALIRDCYSTHNISLDHHILVELLASLESKENKSIDYLKPFE